ncbi:hypothetical protein ACET8Y_03610 [Aeromonas veronii]
MIDSQSALKNNMVYFRQNDIHVGSGFIFSFEEESYCVTAGHVIFGRDFDKEIKLDAYDSAKNHMQNLQLITGVDFAISYDLAVFKLINHNTKISPVSIFHTIHNPNLISCSYVQASCLNEPSYIPKIEFNEKLESNKFKVTFPSDFLHHFSQDLHGADAVAGYSGSPIILQTPSATSILHGIITRIPNYGVGSIVEVRSLEPLSDILPGLKIKSSDELDDDHSLITYHLELLENDRFTKWVDQWKNETENKNYYSNLQSKLKVIFGDQYEEELPKELQRIMIGDAYIKQIIETNTVLYSNYQNVVKTAEREHMVAFVNNAREAYEHYQQIYRDHLNVVSNDLNKFDLKLTEHKKIAQHDVSTWLAVCNLRFCDK